ncbi:MAG TPA: YceI family protein [Gemmatimonadaceae bacterium]|jgi:polyisoprenoid-binding protein YceI|nr:YceI family protein [Gemmatimonadaceae bacterium]
MSAIARNDAGSAVERLAGTWKIDPAHSGIEFVVTHLMISKVRGRFTDIAGTVVTDGTPEGSRVEAEIGAASITTNDVGRDTHLRSADFFDVEKFPKIRFVSTAVKADGSDEFVVTGDLTIRGVTRSIDMKVTSEGSTRDPWGNDRAGFSGSARIDRRDFGLTWNQALEAGGVMVSNEVKLTVDVELTHVPQ